MNTIIINKKNQVMPENIIFFKADINYSIAYYSDGKKETIVKSLKNIEPYLKQYDFYRIHKSFLINIGFISQFPDGLNLEMQDEYVLSISRRKLSGLRKVLKKSKFQIIKS